MKLEKWASIAEIVSGVAVVVTLVFLIVGIRDNTEVTRAAVYDRNIDSLNEWRILRLENPNLNQLWSMFAAAETDSLNESDLFDLRVLALMLFGIYEKSYFASKYGVLGQSEWQRFELQICRNFERVEMAGISLYPALSAEFLAFINEECSDNGELGD